MIQKRFLDAWRYAQAPWPTYAMVEQDLVISRALVDLYNQPKVKVSSEWFSGEAQIKTYQLDELMGSKLRALYQRRKGRDLFDLWFLLSKQMLNVEKVIKVFKSHGKYTKQEITKKMFEKNMLEKAKNEIFRNEITNLITDSTNWDFDIAHQIIASNIIA